MKQILFLCSGNYYRSRFAEVLFNWMAGERGLDWRATSRGLALDARNAGPISSYTLSNLRSRGIVCGSYDRLPQMAVAADFAAADRVVAVKEKEHRPIIEARFAAWRDRIEYWRVDDVDYAPPEVALPQLEREVCALVERISPLAA